MARIALHNLIAAERQSDPLSVEFRDLRSQLLRDGERAGPNIAIL